MAEKTLREFSVTSTDNVATGPNINVGDMNFELKSSLINIVHASPFWCKLNEDANANLQNFLELCEAIVIWEPQLMPSNFVYFPFPSWETRSSGFTRIKRPSALGTNAPRCFWQNSSRWAKPMPYEEEFQVSSRKG